MNLLLYIAMSVAGYLGTLHELLFERTNKSLFSITVLLFILSACSRIGYSPADDDLSIYINLFQHPDEIYFEPGYIFVSDVIRFLLGSAPSVLVVTVCLWIVCFFVSALLICIWFYDRDESFFQKVLCASYLNTMLFVMILYWGCFFAAETLRVGMAISLLYCSCALAINNKVIFSVLLSLIAALFHLSCMLFTIGLVIMFVLKNLNMEQKQFLIWFFVMVAFDVIVGVFRIVSLPAFDDMFEIMSQIEMLTHFTSYRGEENEGYMNTQYITYHLLGLLMIWGNLDDKRFNKIVILYYIGLSIGTIFQFMDVVIRIQWLFLAMIVFAFYYFIKDDRYSFWLKNSVISFYAIVQMVMLLRVLGWHM